MPFRFLCENAYPPFRHPSSKPASAALEGYALKYGPQLSRSHLVVVEPLCENCLSD